MSRACASASAKALSTLSSFLFFFFLPLQRIIEVVSFLYFPSFFATPEKTVEKSFFSGQEGGQVYFSS